MTAIDTERRTVNRDFIVSAHALERFEERFPELWTHDNDIAAMIHREVQDAFAAGRYASYAPLELASLNMARQIENGGVMVWEPTKMRGYVVQDDDDGMLVVTVVRGEPLPQARRKLQKIDRRRKK